MLKKTVLTFAFLLFFTSFYGFNSRLAGPAFDDETLSRAGDAAMHAPLLGEGEYAISAYDEIIRTISEREGNDWRLMSAIAYHESRFTADIVSRRGARGLMQIMPSVAGQFDVPVSSISDPEVNVWLANKLMSEILSTLRLSPEVSEQDRTALVLAAYNSGIGHVSDARRLARLHGENPDSWEVVARYLALESEPEYYEHEAVRCGRFTGSRQTLAYVRDVMGRYDKYRRMTVR